jgi:threonine/homoserine/homoserine lactone efflux protein
VPKATVQRSAMGAGCLIQGIALTLMLVGAGVAVTSSVVLGVVALVGAIVLFFVGGNRARRWVCSECRNPIAHRGVKICPVCRAEL